MVLEVGLILTVFVASQNFFESLGGVSARTSQLSAELHKSMKDLSWLLILARNAEPFGISDSFNSVLVACILSSASVPTQIMLMDGSRKPQVGEGFQMITE